VKTVWGPAQFTVELVSDRVTSVVKLPLNGRPSLDQTPSRKRPFIEEDMRPIAQFMVKLMTGRRSQDQIPGHSAIR
jgi:hypothetical protein